MSIALTSNAGCLWVDLQYRGIAVSPGAVPAFLRDRWRISGRGVRRLRTFAGGLRRATQVKPTAVTIPGHVRRTWEALGRPDCWINYRPDGMSCLIVIPGDRVVRVPRDDTARMRHQFVRAAAIQAQFAALAPEVLSCDSTGRYCAEAYLSLVPGQICRDEIETTISRMRAMTPNRTTSVSSYLAGLSLPPTLRREADRLDRQNGATRITLRDVHGDLMPHNLWRGSDGRLVVVDWEFSREAPASYDFWHLHFLPWIRGEISTTDWVSCFRDQLCRHLPYAAGEAELHHRLNALSTAAFLSQTGYDAHVPAKRNGLERLLTDTSDGTASSPINWAQEGRLT